MVYTNYRKMDSTGTLTGRLGFDPGACQSHPVDTPALQAGIPALLCHVRVSQPCIPWLDLHLPETMLQGRYALPDGAVTQDFWVVLVAYLRYTVSYLDVATIWCASIQDSTMP